jgi:hypothetical protein
VDGRGRLGRSRCRDDVFLADEFSERDDAIGDRVRVLDEVGDVTDNAWNEGWLHMHTE